MVKLKRCFACGSSVKENKVVLHRFPKDPITYSKWKHFCCLILPSIREEDDFKNYFLCSRHFTAKDYIRFKTLSKDAIPIILKNNRVPEYEGFIKQVENVEDEVLQIQSDVDVGEFDIEREPVPVKPFGDDLLRVCRTCFRIMKTEEAVPLISLIGEGLFEETDLCIRLKSLLQLDLFAVENPCVCMKCETFVNAVHSFRSTCRANEDVLKDFDWDCKTLNLLYVVDQDELKAVYDVIKMEKLEDTEKNDTILIKNPNESVESECLEQVVKENGLSDVEDHWYSMNEMNHKNHDYTSRTQMASCSTSTPKNDDLIFKTFEKVQTRVSTQLRKSFKRLHYKAELENHFVCELCGKVRYSKAAFNRHVRLHKASNGFQCSECNKVLSEWNSFLKHCRSVHGIDPRTFKCP